MSDLNNLGKESECALGVEKVKGDCFDDTVINKIVGAIEQASNMKDVKEELKCETNTCVLESNVVSNTLTKQELFESKKALKPVGPSNSTALLDNNNIDNVLFNLTGVFKKFRHMHFQMIDFAGDGKSVPPTELGKLDMVADVINNKYDTFGVVINTDVRTGGGIHWFALFCDFRKPSYTVEYFNSSGNPPVLQIQEWMAKTVNQIKGAGYENVRKVVLRGLQHQQDSETECGPYSLYYIWKRLNGVSPMQFQNTRVEDNTMIEFRKHLFEKK
jgi:hypothetical protein